MTASIDVVLLGPAHALYQGQKDVLTQGSREPVSLQNPAVL